MSTRVAILQSNYIPWKGYFDLIRSVDHFVLYDTAQYTKNDWRNRNRIRTAAGPRWLTIPVRTSGQFGQPVRDVTVADGGRWATAHWSAIEQAYRTAPHFAAVADVLRPTYAELAAEPHLSRINYRLLTDICQLLGITTPITWSSEYELVDGQTERLIGLCRSLGGTRYLSGPAARDYVRPELFAAAGIALEFADYGDYPPYPQLHADPFAHAVSILDLLFNVGPGDTLQYTKRL